MKIDSLSCSLAAIFCCLSPANAAHYKIDTVSCTPAQITFIEAGITGANEMAAAGLAGITNPNAAQQQLITWLFGSVAHGTSVIGPMFNAAAGATRFTTPLPNGQALGSADVKIYCDQSRFDNNGIDTDPDLGPHVPTNPPTPTSKTNCAITLAYTYNPVGGHFWQITICPWFLKYAMQEQLHLDATITTQIWAKIAKAVIPVFTKLWPYTPIDGTSLFEKVLLHEFTHTHVSPVRRTTDVGGWNGYGWKNCRRISTQVTDNLTPHVVLGPEFNADTFALYGSASRSMLPMIARGRKLNADGVFAPVARAARAVGVRQVLQDMDRQ